MVFFPAQLDNNIGRESIQKMLLSTTPLMLIASCLSFGIVHGSSKIGAEGEPQNDNDGDDNSSGPPISHPVCGLPKDRGNACTAADGNGTAGVKWYFDRETFECLAFGFQGCGGNANRFNTIFDCRHQCHPPADYGACSGRLPPAKNAQGQNILCSGATAAPEKCPSGYRCQNLAFYGICCEIKNEEMYGRNYRPSCANGKVPHQLFDPVNHWPVIFLGKQCQDHFCPAGTECQQLEVFAHCCPK